MNQQRRSPTKSRNSSENRQDCISEQQSLPTLEELISNLPCRRQEIQTLTSIFGKPHHLVFQSVFVHGHASTGKTHVLQTLISELNIKHVWINCIVVYNQHLLFEAILNQLLSAENTFGSIPCDNICDFIFHLKNIIEKEELDSETLYIVFDKAEELCKFPPTFLASFLRLQELTQRNLSVIFISENSWDKFHFGSSYFCEPFLLYFPQYKKEELVEILLLDCPDDVSSDFFRRYLHTVMNVFYVITHNLQELRYIALSHFEQYCKPIKCGEAEENEPRRLWKFIEPHYKNALKSVYLRESRVRSSYCNEDIETQPNIDETELRANVELPFFSKFLLLASYIASYNPPKSDKQMFLKNAGRMRKRVPHAGSKRIVSQHDQGPKAFPLHRMLSIFYSIIEEEPKPSTYLLSQVSTLVSLRLLLCLNNDISYPKYKCVVSLEFIKNIAKTVKFEIAEYLSDFL